MAQVQSTEWTLEAKDSGKAFSIKGSVTVGRQPECEIAISDGCVSRQHARLFIRDEALVVEDLGSLNGTSVNGKRIKQVVLKDGDEIGFDRYLFRVIRRTSAKPKVESRLAKPADSRAGLQASPSTSMPDVSEQAVVPLPAVQISQPKPEPAQNLESAPKLEPSPRLEPEKKVDSAASPAQQEVLPRKTKWWQRPSSGPQRTVYIESLLRESPDIGPQLMPPSDITEPVLLGLSEMVKGRRITLRAGSMIVGRSAESDSVIDDSRVSDKHAQIIVEDGSISVVSLPNCTNGTFVNRARAGGRVYLKSGDVVSFGDLDFVFWLPGDTASSVQSTRGLNRVYAVAIVVAAVAVIAALAFLLARG